MLKIDAHQHFWKYRPDEYGWINEEMSVLKKDYLPDELKNHLNANGFNGCIAVQARQNRQENEFLLGLAGDYPFIKGVVGWVDLQADDVDEKLERLSRNPALCGIRHLVQDEPDDEFLLRDKFLRGVGYLKNYDLCYDILVFPKHLAVAEIFVKQFPDQRFVIDHIAKPDIKNQVIEPWASGMKRIAQYPNVGCKLSGMVTEANWGDWSKADFRPYLDVVLEAFGADRLLIGSDWPVCKLAGEYDEVIGIVTDYISRLSSNEQENIYGGNAMRFYGLKE
jgi:L-fuconolactonase